MRLWLLYGLLVSSLSGLVASTASAQSSQDTIARAHFQAGSGYFDTGDYEAAVREFERAYALSPHPPLLYNLYAAHERLGNIEQAVKYLEQYLATASDVTNREALEARLSNLRRRLTEPGDQGAPVAMAPPDAHAEPQPVAEAEPVDGAQGGGSPGHSRRFWLGVVSLSVGGAGLATFAVAGGLALKEDHALAKRCGRDAGMHCSEAQLSGLHTRTLVSDLGLGLGVVGAVVGVTLLWLDRREARVRPSVHVDARGAGLALGGRF